MNEDRIAGATETLVGKARATIGTAVGDNEMALRGRAQQFSGKRRNIAGSLRDFFAGTPDTDRGDEALDHASFTGSDIMNDDQIKGTVRNVKGKIEKGVGDVTTDTKWQADGIVDQVAGTAQNLYGRAKDKVGDFVDDAPDAIARAGDTVRDAASRSRVVANEQVRENPVLLAAIAGVAAYALAWVIHGRRA